MGGKNMNRRRGISPMISNHMKRKDLVFRKQTKKKGRTNALLVATIFIILLLSTVLSGMVIGIDTKHTLQPSRDISEKSIPLIKTIAKMEDEKPIIESMRKDTYQII
jgi:hypothetical protein